MAHLLQQQFCSSVKQRFPDFFKNKKVLDVGSLDVNGNNRFLFENCDYIGLDVAEGKNVTIVASGNSYDAPDEYFDVIISTEAFEHDISYEDTIKNIIRMLKPGGLFLFTCASTGRPEHGTLRTSPQDAPLLKSVSEEWANYYKNLEEHDIRAIEGFNSSFLNCYFEYNVGNFDLYFWGIKNTSNTFLNVYDVPEPKYSRFNDDIFVIDSWTDTLEKKQMLVDLIKKLKVYGAPILLATHYPVETEIQSLVDYYLYDNDNPLLTVDEFSNLCIGKPTRWSGNSDYRYEGNVPFHHDYAIWKTLGNAFSFCEHLGKKNIHFLEYDCLPDEYQYRQCFLERINNHDAVFIDYSPDSIDVNTFLFSIKTEVGLKIVKSIDSKFKYYNNRHNGFQLERVLISELRKINSNILSSGYIDCDQKLNICAVWNRDGILKAGEDFTIYTCCDAGGNLFLNLISKISAKEDGDSIILLEVNYLDFKKFIELKPDSYEFLRIGFYQKGGVIKCFTKGIKIFEELLIKDLQNYYVDNKLLVLKDPEVQNEIKINWSSGPKIEIIGNQPAEYNIKFIDSDNENCIYEAKINNNCWAQCCIKYFVNWRIEVTQGVFVKTFSLDLSNEQVLINFQSSSLGDQIAWVEAVNQFQIKHNCKLTCKIFAIDLFKDRYNNINFVTSLDDLDLNGFKAIYELGLFYDGEDISKWLHRTNPLSISLGAIADDILNVDAKNIVPKISAGTKRKKPIKKTVCIATQSTAQCKYWNNESGWEKTVDYLKSLGYDVICIDRYPAFGTKDGFNSIPKNCIDKTGDFPLRERIEQILDSDFFIGLSSGLSWLAWACKKPVVLISGFTDVFNEFDTPYRVINKNVCNSCWNDIEVKFDKQNWLWCPKNKNFECSKQITFKMVKEKIDECIKAIASKQ